MQRVILGALPADGWISVADLATIVYGTEPSESQRRAIRRAVASLVNRDLVQSCRVWDGAKRRRQISRYASHMDMSVIATWVARPGIALPEPAPTGAPYSHIRALMGIETPDYRVRDDRLDRPA